MLYSTPFEFSAFCEVEPLEYLYQGSLSSCPSWCLWYWHLTQHRESIASSLCSPVMKKGLSQSVIFWVGFGAFCFLQCFDTSFWMTELSTSCSQRLHLLQATWWLCWWRRIQWLKSRHSFTLPRPFLPLTPYTDSALSIATSSLIIYC